MCSSLLQISFLVLEGLACRCLAMKGVRYKAVCIEKISVKQAESSLRLTDSAGTNVQEDWSTSGMGPSGPDWNLY